MVRIDPNPKTNMNKFLELKKKKKKIPSLGHSGKIFCTIRTKEAEELFASDNGEVKLLPSSVCAVRRDFLFSWMIDVKVDVTGCCSHFGIMRYLGSYWGGDSWGLEMSLSPWKRDWKDRKSAFLETLAELRDHASLSDLSWGFSWGQKPMVLLINWQMLTYKNGSFFWFILRVDIHKSLWMSKSVWGEL